MIKQCALQFITILLVFSAAPDSIRAQQLEHRGFMIDMTRISQGFIQKFQVEPLTLALGFSGALGVGIISGGLPAVQVVRRTVSEGLRRIG